MNKFDHGLWAAPPREPGPVPSWIAPKKERIVSRSPLRAPSGAPSSEREIVLRDRLPNIEQPRASEELRAPRTPTIPPPTIADKCGDCDTTNEKLEKAEAALRDALAANETLRHTLMLECEGELVRLALAVAERVVGRELRTDPSLVARWAREAIDSLDGGGQVVATAPDVEAPAREGNLGVPVIVDPSLPPGMCEVRGSAGRVVASAEARLEAVAEALGVDSE